MSPTIQARYLARVTATFLHARIGLGWAAPLYIYMLITIHMFDMMMVVVLTVAVSFCFIYTYTRINF